MFRYQPGFKLYLLVIDFCIIMGSFLLALGAMPGPIHAFLGHSFLGFLNALASYLIFAIIILGTFFYNDLYKRHIVTTIFRQFVLIVKSLLIGTIVCLLILLIFNVHFLVDYGKTIFASFLLISLCLFSMTRVAFTKRAFLFLTKKKLYPIRILIVGADREGLYIAHKLSKDRYSNFQICAFLDDYKPEGASIQKDHTNQGHLKDIGYVAEKFNIDEIFVAIHNAPYNRLIHIVQACLDTGRLVRIYSDLLKVVHQWLEQ